jgi:DMSO reductase family type II enzyme chaperone
MSSSDVIILKDESKELLAKARAYQLLSMGFMYPDSKWFQSFSEFLSSGKHQYNDTLSGMEQTIRDSINTNLDLKVMANEYHLLFTAGQALETAPYETEYIPGEVFAKTRELADIMGFYRAFGLDISPDLNERPDHVTVELQFMAMLYIKEAYAWNTDSTQRVEVCIDARKKFLKDHLGMWMPSFCSMIESKTGVEYYNMLSKLALNFLKNELEDNKIKPESVKSPEKPRRKLPMYTSEEEDDSCQM